MATEINFYKVDRHFETCNLPFFGFELLRELYDTRRPYVSCDLMNFVEYKTDGYGEVPDHLVSNMIEFIEEQKESLVKESGRECVNSLLEALKSLDINFFKIVGSRIG